MFSRLRGIVIIAGYRLQLSFRTLFLWIVVATALAAFIRVLLAAPLALIHVLTMRRRRRTLLAFPGATPGVTVLLPAFNESKVIASTLHALARCQPQPVEVIVLDDGSTDDTASVARQAIKEIASQYPYACPMRLVTLLAHGHWWRCGMSTATVDDAQDLRRDDRGRVVARDGYPLAGLATIDEATAISRMSRSYIYGMIGRGDLDAKRFGRSCRITWASIRAAFLE